MTATQAPTPGPLSGDDVNRECKTCGAFKAERDAACAFCGIVPTAPVEASGSERERFARAIDPYAWDDAQYAEPGGKGQQWSQEAARKAADRVLALRPQPSGETR